MNALDGWDMHEPGWWTRDGYGGVVQEGKGWGCYPLDLKDDAPAHKCKTRNEAMRWIENRYDEKANAT